MENIENLIKKEKLRLYSGFLRSNTKLLEKLRMEKKKLYEDYNNWIDNLKISMHLCKYRQVIGEIEAKKNKFREIKDISWKYQYIEMDAIFKIVKKKIFSHSQDIIIEGSHHYHSCLFWFNKIYIILEYLLVEIRPDINSKLNYKNKDILKPIQCAIDCFIKLCYILLMFAYYNQQLQDILTYISVTDRITPFMGFTEKSSSYKYLQKIQLFKVKILMENCDFMTAINTIEENINFSCEYIRILSDEDFNAYVFDLTDEKTRRYQEHLNKRRIFKNAEYRKLMQENENKSKNKNKSEFNIKEFSGKFKKRKFSAKKLKNHNKQKSIKKSNLPSLEDKKITSSASNLTNNTNTTNINNNNKTFQKTEKDKKIMNINPINANINKTLIMSDSQRMNIFLTQIKQQEIAKRINKEKKRIIEEILNNITLFFYFRGAIFEHVGSIDSALDSYKEVEWFSIKFLPKQFPQFVRYMTSLLNCAWSNYNIIYKLKYEKEKARRRNEILRRIELEKKMAKLEAQKRHNEEAIPSKSSQLYKNQKLNNFLINLGNKIYKQEELRNFNIYNKFSKTGYILSTYKMIDELLSDDLKPILKKMKKVDVTKPGEEIKDLIDKALIKKQHQQNYIKENNKSIVTNKVIKKLNNTRVSSSINMKENNSVQTTKDFGSDIKSNDFRFKNLKRRKEKRLADAFGGPGFNYSTGCEIINNKDKKITIPLLRNNFNIHKSSYNTFNKIIKEKTNNSSKFIKIKSTLTQNQKIKSGMSSLRSSYEKVEKYEVDKDNFNKNMMRKKKFLDKFSNKEFLFLKNLLKTKSVFPEVIRPMDDLELKKIKQDANLNFNMKLELAKSGRGKKNLKNLIKTNLNMNKNVKNKFIPNRSNTSTDKSENNIMDNDKKLEQLENECMNIALKKEKLIKKKYKICKAD
jgi:hypothetical protein